MQFLFLCVDFYAKFQCTFNFVSTFMHMQDKGLKWAMVTIGDFLQTLNVLTLYDDWF